METLYTINKLVKSQINDIVESTKENDEVTMNLLQAIGNDINQSIQLEVDYPSRNIDNKLPILDIKVWVEEVGNRKLIMYEHYRKEVATKATIHAKSAVPTTIKRTVLTQEVLRVMTHCSPFLPINIRNEHTNEIMKRIQFSGYPKEFRFDVYNSAQKAYTKLKEDEECGRKDQKNGGEQRGR